MLVDFNFMLDPIVKLKVVVLQGGGAPRGEPVVGTCTVKKESSTDGS